MNPSTTLNGLEIAIVGMAGRFPGARTLSEFWENIQAGKESITFFTQDELRAAGVRESLLSDPNYVPARGILGDVDRFDASFFGYSPKEATMLDPQHRLFLETAWQALETAGHDPSRYPGRVGVFASVGFNSYLVLNLEVQPDFIRAENGPQAMLSNDKDFLATRVSYKLGLTGPSVVVQSACSSSLVAVHEACQSLLAGEADMALAGGVTLRLPEHTGHYFQDGMINSPDGHCRPFDKDAAGTVAGNGIGVVVLKRLEDALKDRDYIHAVIKGSAVNNDGSDKVGYAAPSAGGQARVIELAQALAEVPAASIGYVETHGSGTHMGDPIEIEALRLAFRKTAAENGFCAVGSVKANIGHLDSAAGVAGLMRAALAVERGMVPPNANYREANPLCGFDDSPFYVPTEARPWPELGSPRRAGVSSFGMGGTNAHVVIEQAPERPPSGPSRPWQLLCVSAKTTRALDRMKDGLRGDLQQFSGEALADIAYTLHQSRQHFGHTTCIVARDAQEAAESLSSGHNAFIQNAVWDNTERLLTFAFSGQGSQFLNMGRTLYEYEASFAAEVDHCAQVLEPILGCRLQEILFGEGEDAAGKLNQTAFTQPALFVVEYALARLLMRWGLQPEALIGHSIGEYVAACLAGVFSLEDALFLVAHRGRLIQSLPSGAMLLVPQAPKLLEPYLSERVALAVINAPELSVLSGDHEAIALVESALEADGIRVKRLQTSHAFHSPMMEPILDEFRALLRQVTLQAPSLKVISNLTGDWLTPEQATDPDYWAKHLRGTVQFAKGVEKLSNGQARLFVEVGPGSGLTQFIRQTVTRTSNHLAEAVLPKASANEPDDALFQVLSALGRIWSRGFDPNWTAFYDGQHRNRLPLSPYPFQGESYWVNFDQLKAAAGQNETHGLRLWTESWRRVALRSTLGAKTGSEGRWLCIDTGQHLRDHIEMLSAVAGKAVYLPSRPGRPVNAPQSAAPQELAAWAESFASASAEDGELQLLYVEPLAARDETTATLAEVHLLLKALLQHMSEKGGRVRLTLLLHGVYRVLGTEVEVGWQGAALERLLTAAHSLQPALHWRVIDIGEPAPPGFGFRIRSIVRSRSSMARRCFDVSTVERLSRDWPSFSHGSVLAYREGQRWVRSLETVTPPASSSEPPAVVLLAGGIDPLTENLIVGWHEAFGSRFVLLDGREDDTDNSLAIAAAAQRLAERGVDVELLPATHRAAVVDAIHRYAEGGKVVFWRSLTAQAAPADEILLHLAAEDIARIVAHSDADFDQWRKLPVAETLWLIDSSLCFAHPPYIAGALAAARFFSLAGSAEHRYLHWDAASLNAQRDLTPADLARWVANASETSAGEFAWLSAVAPGSAYWRPKEQIAADAVASEEAGKSKYARPDLPTPYAAPVTERQKIICSIWQSLFEVDRVGIRDNFFDFGGDSIMALKLLSALETHFRVALPLAEVFNSPTVADQANAIHEYSEIPMDKRELSPLVALRKEGDRPPFFCAHPAGGIVHCYIELSRALGKDQPFYGFQHPGIDGKSGIYTSYEKMAELYIDSMLEVQPEGPYYIGGWSFGGTVAFEMARQLHARGKEVAMLALFDSPGPSTLYKLGDRPDFEFAGMMTFLSQALSSMFGSEINVPVEELRTIPREQQLDYLLSRTVKASGEGDLMESKEALERIIDIFELTDKGERQFKPTPFDGAIHMYRVQEMADYEFTAYKNHPRISAASFGWDELCRELVVRFVPGTHMSMIFPPNVDVLAEKFGADLKRLMSERTAGERGKADTVCAP